jgi:hypothetical protein
MCDLGDQNPGQGILGCPRHTTDALGIDQQQFVVILAEGGLSEIADQKRYALASTFVLGVGLEVFGFGGKTDTVGRIRQAGHSRQNVGVLRELEQCVAATLESGFLTGTGTSDHPLGVVNTPGIGSQSFAGSVPTLAELVGMVESYADANGDLSAARWLLNPSDLADLLKAQVDADGGELIVQYIDGAHRIAGVPVFATAHLTEGKHLLMDPTAVALVYFGGAQVVLDEYSGGKAITGAAEICTFNYADLAVLRPAHIVLGSS